MTGKTDDCGSIEEILDLRLKIGDIDAIAAWISLNEARVEAEILGRRPKRRRAPSCGSGRRRLLPSGGRAPFSAL